MDNKVIKPLRVSFKCDESMIITIPIGNLMDMQEGQLMPEKFHCVFKDNFKVFVNKGKPKPLGAAQSLAGVFVIALGFVFGTEYLAITLPSVLFVVCGMLSYAAGHSPNMHVAKMSFSLNIISFFWSIAVVVFCSIMLQVPQHIPVFKGILALVLTLHVVENMMSLFLIYWLSKAICREQFNTLPIIKLKQNA
ncbi:uncharacterized protein LOC143003205 [Genypterus blacodes]|uniref:uncharacterized protein LOC143003205 n=1 Tax=Genypterus blacodes TaxID=154954 RepID=UPI003F76034C